MAFRNFRYGTKCMLEATLALQELEDDVESSVAAIRLEARYIDLNPQISDTVNINKPLREMTDSRYFRSFAMRRWCTNEYQWAKQQSLFGMAKVLWRFTSAEIDDLQHGNSFDCHIRFRNAIYDAGSQSKGWSSTKRITSANMMSGHMVFQPHLR